MKIIGALAGLAVLALLVAVQSEAQQFPLANYARCPATCRSRESFCMSASCPSCTKCKACGAYNVRACTTPFSGNDDDDDDTGSRCLNNLDLVTRDGVDICTCKSTRVIKRYRDPANPNRCLSCDTRTSIYNAITRTCCRDDDDDNECDGSTPTGPCGGSGEACCSGATCNSAGLVCNGSNVCAACGSSGDLCCSGGVCNSGYQCTSGNCISTDGDDD